MKKGLICLVHSQKMTTEIGGIYFDQSSLHHQKDLYYKHKERGHHKDLRPVSIKCQKVIYCSQLDTFCD